MTAAWRRENTMTKKLVACGNINDGWPSGLKAVDMSIPLFDGNGWHYV
jgi:hypothetical protein